jgi:hypothetical protein
MAVSLRFGRILPIAGVAVLHFGGYVVVTEAALAASLRWQTQIALDAYVPHLPWMWPFYWAAYPYLPRGGFLLLNLPEAGFRRALAVYSAMILAGVSIQLAIPAHSPSPHLPHPGQALIHWSSLERGFATLPSMHVALCTLTAGIALVALTPVVLKSAYALLALLISVSTLTLQEHVVLDLATGLALGGVAAWPGCAAALEGGSHERPSPHRRSALPSSVDGVGQRDDLAGADPPLQHRL